MRQANAQEVMLEDVGSRFQALSWEDCDRQLQQDGAAGDRAALHTRMAAIALQRGTPTVAIAQCQQALQHQPDAVAALHYQGLAQEQLGQWPAALASYDRAIAHAATPSPQLWGDRGNLLRGMGRYAEALKSYEQVLAIDPDQVDALSAQGSLLALLGKRRQALQVCDRTLQRFPQSAQAWSSKGVVLSMAGRLQPAIECFNQAIERQPDLDRAWCNRGTTLLRMGQTQMGIDHLTTALTLRPHSQDFWKAAAYTSRGYGFLQMGNPLAAIADCDQALALRPHYPPAALYRLGALILSGQWLAHLRQPQLRRQLLQNLGTVLNVLKYRLLAVAGLFLLLSLGQGVWVEALQSLLSTALSVGIVALVLADLWRQRTRFAFIRRVYLGHGWLPYLRAVGIIVATLGTYAGVDAIAPPFLRWGWATAVFGQPGNVIFQPFHLLSQGFGFGVAAGGAIAPSSLAPLAMLASAPAPSSWLTPATLFILGFWWVLLMGIPFWSHLEERIFRRGAHSWRKIAVRSTQFGLVHLLAGIPILGGFVLILPGFLFACRYKYIYHRTLHQTGDSIQAEEAGVLASTSDHAAYNAILITFAVLSLLLLRP